ncbi:hotdog family protein [Shewanella sp. OMA3-2]|uniref:hotdog family protein n=1 Tax=Shewanella sp. OMA3-2 TaxID=2908650 RepID=UPI001F2D69DC|nr:hotdog family protein [Shewanella sp. OMA3-2]UJF22494.1 hotdog family protein [Shewanella sp. OMA3-2]
MTTPATSTQPLIASAALLSQSVSEFIPHRAPMILIDSLISHQHDGLITQTHITSNSAYFDPLKQGVPSYVGVEYMAQSIAALAGVEALIQGLPIKVGFLLGSRKLQLHQSLFKLGQTYRTHVARLYQEESGLAVFDCQVFQHQILVAQANINVFQPTDTLAYINNSHS